MAMVFFFRREGGYSCSSSDGEVLWRLIEGNRGLGGFLDVFEGGRERIRLHVFTAVSR